MILTLALGTGSALAAFLSSAVGQVVTTIYSVVLAVFTAQFYVAASGRADASRLAKTFE